MADNTHNKALPQELSQPNYRTISETRTEKVSPAKLDKPSVVELKNGKLVLRQKPLSLEKLSETMQEIVLFRQMLEQRLERQDPPLETIPDQYIPLIAKFVHESDKTLQALSKYIHHELLPVHLDDEEENANSSATHLLPLHVLEVAIKNVATRTNYGLESHTSGIKVPAQMCIWRWEVDKDQYGWFPKSLKDKIEARLTERRQAKKDAVALVESFSSEGQATVSGSRISSTDASSVSALKTEESDLAELVASNSGSNDPPLDLTLQKGVGRPKKNVDSEKAVKDKQKQEKKLAKAEKEKKVQESQNKSRNLMASFFSKPRPMDGAPGIHPVTDQSAEASTSKSDFERTFKSFALRKGVDVAPINWFQEKRRGQQQKVTKLDGHEVIIIDDDRIPSPLNSEVQDDIGQMTDRGRLNQIKSSLSQISGHDPHRRSRQTSDLKTHSKHSVRATLNELAEAEVSGDTSAVRSLYGLLGNRSLVPARVLIFAGDSRPGYHGTWTRNSTVIGPRTPFARDIVALDYSYDSGEDWEDEDPGEADDVVEDEDDDEQDEGKDSDEDSWLVDDDDIEPESPSVDKVLPLPSGSDFSVPLAALSKRKAVTPEPAKSYKKRKVVPLVPFIKGPSWESSIESTPGIFVPYRISLFNDVPCPIDPFTCVVSLLEEEVQAQPPDPRFVVPPLPTRILLSSNSNETSSSHTVSAPTGMKKSLAAPKHPFPDAHLPALLTRITSLGTGSLMLIVEAVYQDLKDKKVKKKSIEAKVREVAAKENKIWVVKVGLQTPETML